MRHSEPMTCVEATIALLLILISIAMVLWVTAIFGVTFSKPSTSNRINLRIATRQAVPTPHLDMVTTRDSSSVVKVLLMEVSAYSPRVCETDGDPLTMASGQKVRVGAIASDWTLLPEGSLVRIPGYNNGQPCVCLDTGGSIKGFKLDIFLWSTEAAIQWGRRKNVPVEILRIGE